MRRRVAVLSVASVMLLGTGLLVAGQPDMYTFSGGASGYVGSCGGFEVWEDVTWVIEGKDYYNKNGEFIRQKWHWTVEGFVFNSEDSEIKLPYKNSVYNEHYSAETNESRYTGLWALVTLPGYGNIFIDVGVVVFNWGDGSFTLEAGKHQWWEANVEELCQFLAAP